MNHIYNVIWSTVKHCYVVVSELAKRDGKAGACRKKRGMKAAVLAVCALCSIGTVLPVAAQEDPPSRLCGPNGADTATKDESGR